MALTKAHNRMIAGSAVNVLDYGADPTGVADSTAAIQAAIDASSDVYIPEGDYLVTSQITIGSRTHISGASRTNKNTGGTRIKTSNAIVIFYISGDHNKIENLQMRGFNAGATAIRIGDRALSGDKADRNFLENIMVTGALSTGISLERGNYNQLQNITVQECETYGIAIRASYDNDSNANVIVGAHLGNCENAGGTGIGFFVESGTAISLPDNNPFGTVVTGMYIENGDTGVYFGGEQSYLQIDTETNTTPWTIDVGSKGGNILIDNRQGDPNTNSYGNNVTFTGDGFSGRMEGKFVDVLHEDDEGGTLNVGEGNTAIVTNDSGATASYFVKDDGFVAGEKITVINSD
jgi:hypothetical protein